MKQVININFHGQVVPIEVSAFDLLKKYTDSLNRYFANEEGKEEIINDIESRIGELFQERLKKGATCITDEDVNAIIKSMGRPEDFESEQEPEQKQSYQQTNQSNTDQPKTEHQPGNESFKSKRLYRDENDKIIGGVCAGLANYFGIDVVIVRVIFVILAISFGFGILPYVILWVVSPSSATKVIGGTRKKLFRDPDDKFIAGVCSGIANYFGISPWIPRVLFLLPFLSFVFGWSHWGNFDFPHFLQFSFSPGAFIIYVILWFVIPEAFTTAEKLEMKGEKVDLDSIKKSVVEELKGVQQRAEKLSSEAKTFASEKGKVVGSELGGAARRGSRSLGDVIVFIAKAFAYFIIGTVGLSFMIALFALAIASIGIFPIKDFFLISTWQEGYAWGTLLFFIAVPVIGVITWIIRRLAKIKNHSRTIRVTFIALWVVGWTCMILMLSSLSQEFKHSSNVLEEEISLSNPTINKLEVTSKTTRSSIYFNRWFTVAPFENLDEDTAMVKNISIKIVQSPNDSFKVVMTKMACGRTTQEANRHRDLINFNVAQKDSLLLLDRGIQINRTDKFRNQWVYITVYVPIGKQIRIDRSVNWGNNFHFDAFNDDNDDVIVNNEEYGWDTDRTYEMKKEGLFDLKGRPADRDKYQRNHRGTDWDDEDDNENDNGSDVNKQGYRFDERNNISTPKIDSMQQSINAEKKRIADSLQKKAEEVKQQQEEMKKKQEEIDKQLQKIKGVASNLQPPTMQYRLQSYHPIGLI